MKIKLVLGVLLTFVIIGVISFLFLAFCNWTINMNDWNGFSRFIMGAEGVIFLVKLVDAIWY